MALLLYVPFFFKKYFQDVLLQEQIFKGTMLAPGFRAPDPKKNNYKTLDEYILEKLPRDSPPMFRMHPNAEIGYLSTASVSDVLWRWLWCCFWYIGQLN